MENGKKQLQNLKDIGIWNANQVRSTPVNWSRVERR